MKQLVVLFQIGLLVGLAMGCESPTPTPTRSPTMTPVPSATPMPTLTPSPFPTITSSPTIPPSPTPVSPTPTPAFGTLTGRVTAPSPSGLMQPVSGARVELVDVSGFATVTTSSGNYVLQNVPLGQHWVTARSPLGASDSLMVNIQGGSQQLDLVLRVFYPSPTPAFGSIGGQVVRTDPMGSDKPIPNAEINLLNLPTVNTTTDQNGRYTLANVPNGEYFVFARNQTATSDVIPVVVQSNAQTVNIKFGLVYIDLCNGAGGRVLGADGRPVGGAVVWILGSVIRVTTDANGNFDIPWSVDTDRDVLVAIAGERWNYARIPSPCGAKVTINLTRRPTLPIAPVIVYDFVAHANEAQWRNGSGANVWNLPDNDPRGFALWRFGYEMEDGTRPARLLETHPQWINHGTITGLYPQVFVPRATDYFFTTIGFLKNANAGKVNFRVTFVRESDNTQILIGDQERAYNPLFGPGGFVKKFPDQTIGRRGRISLRVDALESSAQDWAAWIAAQIVSEK